MKNLKFKTNINCSGCVANVTSFLNNEPGISGWSVDTTQPQKMLNVTTGNLSEAEVIKIVQQAGYNAERI